MEKASHERMYQGKGRKVIYENDRSSGSQIFYNCYKGIRDKDEYAFDKEWEGAAIRLGINSDVKNYLIDLEQRNLINKSNKQACYDYNSRGVYIDTLLRDLDQPVHFTKNNHIDKLYPTDTSKRTDIPRNTEGKINTKISINMKTIFLSYFYTDYVKSSKISYIYVEFNFLLYFDIKTI